MVSRRYIVSGQVQGVGFRGYVLASAAERGCSGEVWNRRDGNVELIASHEDPAVLSELTQDLTHGPGRVDRVESKETSPVVSSRFLVGPTR